MEQEAGLLAQAFAALGHSLAVIGGDLAERSVWSKILAVAAAIAAVKALIEVMAEDDGIEELAVAAVRGIVLLAVLLALLANWQAFTGGYWRVIGDLLAWLEQQSGLSIGEVRSGQPAEVFSTVVTWTLDNGFRVLDAHFRMLIVPDSLWALVKQLMIVLIFLTSFVVGAIYVAAAVAEVFRRAVACALSLAFGPVIVAMAPIMRHMALQWVGTLAGAALALLASMMLVAAIGLSVAKGMAAFQPDPDAPPTVTMALAIMMLEVMGILLLKVGGDVADAVFGSTGLAYRPLFTHIRMGRSGNTKDKDQGNRSAKQGSGNTKDQGNRSAKQGSE